MGAVLLVAGFPPRRPGFDPRSDHVGFVVDKVALGQVFSEYFGFPCQSSFHRLLHNHHHLSTGAGTIGQQWPTYQVDSVSPHPNKLKKINQKMEAAESFKTFLLIPPNHHIISQKTVIFVKIYAMREGRSRNVRIAL
jgi:hypothetical protein